MMKKNSADTVVLFAGMLLSLLIVIALPGLYFRKDLEAFWQWSDFWQRGWQNIYASCQECNYPILGMFGSAGLLGLSKAAGFERAVFNYRILLGIIDAANVLIVFWILKRLQFKRPAYLAGIVGISISSWAGGALWGQMDNMGQLFILLTLALIVFKNTTGFKTQYLWISNPAAAVLAACFLLTKQLTTFSLLSVGLLLAVDIIFSYRAWKPVLIQLAITLGAGIAGLLFWDIFLTPRPPYFSHWVYIWREGVFQAGIISGNGFNIWMLLGRDMWGSAHAPLFSDIPWLSPYLIGQVLFLGVTAILTGSLALFLKKQFSQGETRLNPEILFNFILHLALINLCFNVFLTGTRERYLFHFYPFILVAWAGLGAYSRLFSEKGLSILVLGASLYGIFILQILSTIDFRLGTTTHLFMAVFHAGLLIYLTWIALRYQGFLAFSRHEN